MEGAGLWSSVNGLTDIRPAAVMDAGLAATDQHLYVFGGRRLSDGGLSSELWRYSLETGRWDRVAGEGNWPRPRCGHSLNALHGELLLFGGVSSGGGGAGKSWPSPVLETRALQPRDLEDPPTTEALAEDQLWRYDTRVSSWTRLASPPRASRSGHCAAVDGARGVLYVHGGEGALATGGSDPVGLVDDVWAWDWVDHRTARTGVAGEAGWAALLPPERGGVRPASRRAHTCAVVEGAGGRALLLSGGTGRGDVLLRDLWRFDLDGRAWNLLDSGTGGSRPTPPGRAPEPPIVGLGDRAVRLSCAADAADADAASAYPATAWQWSAPEGLELL